MAKAKPPIPDLNEAEPVVGGGVTGQRRGQDTLDPAVPADGGDLAFHGGLATAGLASGQGGGQFGQPASGTLA
jgi:hypothetical protein